MRIFSVLLLGLLAGACSSGLTYKDAPSARINVQNAVQMRGVVKPAMLYFTALAARDAGNVRLVVLGDMGVKLLDINVTPAHTDVYYKMDKMPAALAGAFGRMARAELSAGAPERVFYRDRRTGLTFEADVAGGVK